MCQIVCCRLKSRNCRKVVVTYDDHDGLLKKRKKENGLKSVLRHDTDKICTRFKPAMCTIYRESLFYAGTKTVPDIRASVSYIRTMISAPFL